MRGHLQQVRCQLVAHPDTLIGWFLAIAASLVYLLCLEPSVSFWDCGEFIAISTLLQVGHPPGAPLYQLLAHIFSLFAANNMLAVAVLCNALSALAAGLTVMFLYWTILLLFTPQQSAPLFSKPRVAAFIGSCCYLFCDTAWFSAVESEVYSLAMLIASVLLWAMLRWYRTPNRQLAQRWILLIAFLLGLGICVHQLTLLTSPTLLLLFIFRIAQQKKDNLPLPVKPFLSKVLPLCLLFFALGLSPYLIIPIRSATGTPINEGNPSTPKEFKAYLNRDRYEKAPLYPRMWRHHPNDALYCASWNGGDTNFIGNLRFYASYQLTYMYLRYLMWNFSGRYNDRQGYGSPQNGQFLTGFAPIDRLLVGTAQRPPLSLHTKAHNTYYMLPLLLGILGFIILSGNKKKLWVVLSLFLMGGFVLSLYLNHPCYEPRERDYAYILSFYAFCIFIGYGAAGAWGRLTALLKKFRLCSRVAHPLALVLLSCIPALMACQNWDDHDRSGRFLAHDAGANILDSCDSNALGAVLFCYGDNDTFPLWYLQSVEKKRLDVRVENIGLMGWNNFANLLDECIKNNRPVYFTHYAHNQFGRYFPNRLLLEGFAYRLAEPRGDSVAVEPFYRHVMQNMGWHSLEGVYVDEVGCKFLEMYWRDIVLLANNLSHRHSPDRAIAVLNKTINEIPLSHLQDIPLMLSIGQAYDSAGDTLQATKIYSQLAQILDLQLAYFHSISPQRQRSMPYTLAPREQTRALLRCMGY